MSNSPSKRNFTIHRDGSVSYKSLGGKWVRRVFAFRTDVHDDAPVFVGELQAALGWEWGYRYFAGRLMYAASDRFANRQDSSD